MFTNSTTNITIGISDVRKVTSLLKNRFDFDFSQYAMSSFQRRIARIMELNKIPTVDNLTEKLILEPEFHKKFVEEVTVNTTEMFRAPSMWAKLRTEVLDQLKKKNRINIWHAGCSSGEEVYSMAILLKEIGIYDKCTIHATDLSQRVIDAAQAGVYPLRNMEVNAANYRRFGGTGDFESYYTVDNQTVKMNSELLQKVKYSRHNLAQDEPFGKFDLILCRNVMIYFDQVLQDKVFKLCHESLHTKGLFVIGSKESMICCSIKDKFRTINEREKIFQITD